jgi:hypothetical protein
LALSNVFAIGSILLESVWIADCDVEALDVVFYHFEP